MTLFLPFLSSGVVHSPRRYDSAGGQRGAVREAFADVLGRPFPQAVDGEVVAAVFDEAARTLTVEIDEPGPCLHVLGAPVEAILVIAHQYLTRFELFCISFFFTRFW